MIKRYPNKKDDWAGFTLVELLIAMVIFAVALTAIYTSYLTQQKTYLAQSQVTAMQQSLRAGMYHLERELRMAGYDPNRTAGAGFLIADDDELQFTADLNGDGNMVASTNDTNEQVHYTISSGYLRREIWGGGLQRLAENIEVLDLVYMDEDNNPINPGRTDVSSTRLKDIRSVQVTMVAITDQADPDYHNTTVYRNQQGDILLTANDKKRRRLLTSTIRCRNMGL